MAKKGVSGFTNQVARELINQQKRKIKEQEKHAKQLKKNLEKQQREDYINNRYENVQTLTLDIDNYINKLDNIINDGINNYNHIQIEEFIKKDMKQLQLPKDLLEEYQMPTKPITREANIFEKIFKSHKLKYNIYVNEIENTYKDQYKQYIKNEYKRKHEINLLTKMHELQINEVIKTKKELYSNGDIDIISKYKKELLNKSKYPFEFDKSINIGYCKYTKKLVIDYLLPKQHIVPSIHSYKYIKTRDEISEISRKDKDVKAIYNEVIFSIALRSIDEVFKADMYDNIDSIIFNGYIKDIDLATGQDINPYIISTMIDKGEFIGIDITKVDKLKCLKETMRARININSSLEFKDVVPIYKCDYLNKSVTSSPSINLLEVDPFVLEDLVTTLFRNMGYEVEETKKTNDGGIDCILNNSDPIMGGKVIGQVKRYKNNIDIPKLREFESVLRNSDAMKGIFISTSNFSTQCEKFASENSIMLINGNGLVDLFNRYGINSYSVT